MTPLAHLLASDLCLPATNRQVQDQVDLKYRFEDLHCFECSALGDLIQTEMTANGSEGNYTLCNELLPTTFLPSPRTWIELGFQLSSDEDKKMKGAFWLEQPAGVGTPIKLAGMYQQHWGSPSERRPFTFDLPPIAPHSCLEAHIDSTHRWMSTIALLTLAVINQSGLVELRAERPHRGLQKRLDKVAAGSYRLGEWHTVHLPTKSPTSSGEGTSASKCLHFVRSHLRRYRVRANGATVIVPAHWRGDPALGIKRTRYEVEA